MRAHRKLETWQLAREFASRIYEVTDKFPASETYGLVSQLRRAAVSIPANIADGNGQRTTRHYIRHLYDARASLREVDSHLIISVDQSLLSSEQFQALSEDVEELASKLQAQINGLERRIRRD